MWKQNRIRVAAVAMALAMGAIVPAQGRAWNFVGHHVVARIAWDELTPAARQQAKAILRQHPALNADLLKNMPKDFGDRDLFAFMAASSWPDVIRSERNAWNARHHHSVWHYINIPFVINGTDRSQLIDADRSPTDWQPGTEPANAVQALHKCEQDLRDPNLSGPDKAVALSWYLHLAGDIHQPLHANTLFSDRFPAGDRGGNSSMIRAPVLTTQPTLMSIEDLAAASPDDLIRTSEATTGPMPMPAPATQPADSPINLHAYWDNLFGRFGTPVILDALQAEITAQHPPAALRDRSATLAYAAWADESFEIGVRDVRLNGALATGVQTRRGDNRDRGENRAAPSPLPALPADYLPRAQAIARERVAIAGYRIANVLNDALGEK